MALVLSFSSVRVDSLISSSSVERPTVLGNRVPWLKNDWKLPSPLQLWHLCCAPWENAIWVPRGVDILPLEEWPILYWKYRIMVWAKVLGLPVHFFFTELSKTIPEISTFPAWLMSLYVSRTEEPSSKPFIWLHKEQVRCNAESPSDYTHTAIKTHLPTRERMWAWEWGPTSLKMRTHSLSYS